MQVQSKVQVQQAELKGAQTMQQAFAAAAKKNR
jgi:hypothetical protein